MTFKETSDQIILISDERRAQREDFCEVVISVDKLDEALQIMEAHFGPPLKPPGQVAAGEAQKYAEPYGGVAVNQTLYYKKGETCAEMAMLWPWGSGAAITFKLIRL